MSKKKLKDGKVIMTAIIGIVVLDSIALLSGVDGVLLMTSLAAVAGLAGWTLPAPKFIKR